MSTQPVSKDAWRGTAGESSEEQMRSGSLLHARSRALLFSLMRPYRARLTWAGIIITVQTAAALAVPYLIGKGIDGIRPLIGTHRFPHALWVTFFAVLAVLAVDAVLNYLFVSITGRTTQDILRDLRVRVFGHFQRLSLAFYERYTSGRVIARMTSDVDAITELLQTGFNDLITSMLYLLGIAVLLFVLDVPLAIVTLSVLPLIFLLSRWFKRHAEVVYRETRKSVALVIIHFVESLSGIRAVHAYRREPRNQEIMQDVNGRYCAANVESIRLLSILDPALSLIGRLATAGVLVYGASRYFGHQITIGLLFSFTLYVREFFEPLHELSQVYNLLQAAAAALENLSGILEEAPSVAEPVTPVTPANSRGAVTFDGLRFAYRDITVVHDLHLEIPAGQTVALVGETGAGKTTIARLVARFWDPTQGRVVLDGVDLRDVGDAELRRAVSMVTQESFLFSGSVADNIALGKPDATREEIEIAARALGAHAFIAALPQGYDTDVRKRGGRLSAGQRQLVSFARAFLADPKVLILDEATSSLDIPSERLVQRALRTLLADRTALIIAHRLSTVEIADRVLVIDAGRVVEDGTPQDLLAGTGAYAALHTAWVDSLA